jgi:hypothetical protein
MGRSLRGISLLLLTVQLVPPGDGIVFAQIELFRRPLFVLGSRVAMVAGAAFQLDDRSAFEFGHGGLHLAGEMGRSVPRPQKGTSMANLTCIANDNLYQSQCLKKLKNGLTCNILLLY